MDDYLDEYGSEDRTVTLHFGTKEAEMSTDQITTTNIALIFGLDAGTVWLQDRIGSRIYIPDASGTFDLTRHSSVVHGVKVNGVPSSATPLPNSAASAPLTSSSIVTTPAAGSRPPFFSSVTSRKGKVKVKFVRADIAYSGNGRPSFTSIDAMFVDLTEENADVNSMLGLIRNEFGSEYTIVGNDGLPIKDSPATRGNVYS